MTSNGENSNGENSNGENSSELEEIMEPPPVVYPWTPLSGGDRLFFDREKGDTPGAAAMAEEAAALNKGSTVIDLTQGNHDKEYLRLSPVLQEQFTYSEAPYPEYKKDVIIEAASRSVAGFTTRFLGIQQSRELTFLDQQHGRESLSKVFNIVAARHKNSPKIKARAAEKRKVAIAENPQTAHEKTFEDIYYMEGNLRWMLTDGEVADAGMTIIEYDTTTPDLKNSIITSIKNHPDPASVAALGLVSPSNPTSHRLSSDDFDEIVTALDEVNAPLLAEGLPGIVLVVDAPYIYASKVLHEDAEKAAAGEPYLDTGYPGIFRKDRQTPMVFLHSMSKWGEQAGSRGETLVTFTDNKLAHEFRKKAMRTSGVNWNYHRMEKAIETYSAMMDCEWLNRSKETYEKAFEPSRKILMDKLHKIDWVKIIGDEDDIGMLSTAIVDKDKMIGKTITCPDGDVYELKNIYHVCEYLLNRYGVALVPQRTTDPDLEDSLYFRFSQAKDPEHVFSVGVDRFIDGGGTIVNQPPPERHVEPVPELAAA